MSVAERIFTTNTWTALLANPVATLGNCDLQVNQLPAVADGTVQAMWFAAAPPLPPWPAVIAIDSAEATANGVVGINDGALQRQMVLSPMRSHVLVPGLAGRHQITQRRVAGVIPLWITELQTGCSVLILDWGAAGYSMVHMQPSTDAQFNRFGRLLLSTGDLARNSYKNFWLKQELTSVVANTGGVPLRYILVQSMFDASRNRPVQVIGILQAGQFNFYRQRSAPGGRTAQHLQWTAWNAYVPYWGY